MINYYQPFLLPFLSLRKNQLHAGVTRLYYHSFEDALWDLLVQKQVPKGATILLPDFYCMDVVENIRNHGYTPLFYPINKHFQIAPRTLKTKIARHNPAVVIFFHAAGITSRALTPSFIRTNPGVLIVEDNVHRIVNPAKITLYGDNHFIIDSLRKVSPLPGSFIYGRDTGLPKQTASSHPISAYTLCSLGWFVIFRVSLLLSALTRQPQLTVWAHIVALKHHDDIIGDNPQASRGITILGSLSHWFDHKKIGASKVSQAKLYRKLTRALPRSLFYPITIPYNDFSKLYVYPVGMRHVPNGFINALHKLGITVWCKFEDAPWAKRSHVLFLPLGFHVSDEEIRYTIQMIRQLTPAPTVSRPHSDSIPIIGGKR